MNMIIVISLTVAAAFAQDGAAPTVNPLQCPMVMPPRIAPGCHLESSINAQGCKLPKVVCPGCELVDCIPGKICRMIGSTATCIDRDCPEVFPPPTLPGCQVTLIQDENNCPKYEVTCKQTCDDVSCPPGQTCAFIDGAAQCAGAAPCPLYMPPLLKPGCHLESDVDENNCPRPRVVCNDTQCDGENMEMKTCGSPCPETCEQYLTKVYPMCIRKCLIDVCQCKEGYALDADNRCVKRESCQDPNTPVSTVNPNPGDVDPSTTSAPGTCGKNEELKSCGTMCPLTCEMHLTGESRPCPEMCMIDVCQCKSGYALDANQKCISVDKCTLRRKGKGNLRGNRAKGSNCRKYKLAAPKFGCQWEFDKDENNCQVNPHQVCEDSTPPAGCIAFRLAAPPAGCHYEFDKNEQGCDINPHLVCE